MGAGGAAGGAPRVDWPGAAAAAVEDTHGLRVGQGVFHNKFGEGVIVTLEGSGTDARAQINFGRHGLVRLCGPALARCWRPNHHCQTKRQFLRKPHLNWRRSRN